jgi:hypothetical protein
LSEILVKTKKGIAEIERLSNDLSLRVRRVLIQIDGKRSVDEIMEMGLADDLRQVIAKLERDGFIAFLEESDAKPIISKVEVANVEIRQPKEFTFRTIPVPVKVKDIEMAKNFMLNTIQNFCGPWAHLSIVKSISASSTHEELRSYFNPWREAVFETREGRRQEEELTASLLKVI